MKAHREYASDSTIGYHRSIKQCKMGDNPFKRISYLDSGNWEKKAKGLRARDEETEKGLNN